jgi:hypothetical protein
LVERDVEDPDVLGVDEADEPRPALVAHAVASGAPAHHDVLPLVGRDHERPALAVNLSAQHEGETVNRPKVVSDIVRVARMCAPEPELLTFEDKTGSHVYLFVEPELLTCVRQNLSYLHSR